MKWRVCSARIFLAMLVAGAACLSSPASKAQRTFSDRSRQAAINYQNALTAQRNLYYQQEARRSQLATGLERTSRVGDMASTALSGMRSGGSAGNALRGVGGNYVGNQMIQYGGNRVFSSPRVSPRNERFWAISP